MGRICPSLLVRRQTAGPQHRNMTISKTLTGRELKRKEIIKMTIVPFILEHVAKILDWTNDGYEAGIIRELAESLKHLY